MTTIKRQITADEYAKYYAMSAGQFYCAVEKTLPEDILLGYGYYGACLAKENGGYYLHISVGDTCD